MENGSPPKRVTRARAAAKTKTTEPAVKIATAAAKAKATRTMPVPPIRRRTRAQDTESENNDEENEEETIKPEPEKPKTARGRPRKTTTEPTAEPKSEAEVLDEAPKTAESTKSTRGGSRKVLVEESAAPEPARSTRGRPKKVDMPSATSTEKASEPAKKLTRSRAVNVTKPAVAFRKSVKFHDTNEPDKENLVPALNTTSRATVAGPATGIRAKPIRKPAVITRATRGRAKEIGPSKEKSSPLSPKKATQVVMAKDNGSEDELATMEKTPMRALMKSPIKAPISLSGENRRLDFTTSIIANRAVLDNDLGASVMASPARRPPQSAFKETMKTSPKRVLGDSLLRSPFKPAFVASRSAASPLKASFMHSPAKRSAMPTKANNDGSPTTSSFKTSFLQSPAKRPISPTKVNAAGSPSRVITSASHFGATPKPSTFSISKFTTPRTLNKNAFRPGKASFSMARPATEIKKASSNEMEIDNSYVKPFPGRLSAILPRNADPVMKKEALESMPQTSLEPQVNAEVLVEDDESPLDCIAGEWMDIDENDPAEAEEIISTTPTQSPPRHSVGHFGLRTDNEDPFQESESEDELSSESPKYSPVSLSPYNISSNDFALLATPTASGFGVEAPVTVQPATEDDGNRRSLSRRISSKERREKIGFTPLARQLSEWMAASPSKSSASSEDDDEDQKSPVTAKFPGAVYSDIGEAVEQSPGKSTFFDDEMSIRDEIAASTDPDVIDAIDFAPAELDDEDLALAAEADEMSYLDPDVFTEQEDNDPAHAFTEEDMLLPEHDQDLHNVDMPDDAASLAETASVSEASQEYGDENALPTDIAMSIDPALLGFNAPPQQRPIASRDTTFATPRRVMVDRVFHTVSKVPLKPAADDSPVTQQSQKRSRTVSRLPNQRFAPALPTAKMPVRYVPSIQTPVKSSNCSVAVTPARTPRPDLNDQVLRGAVVYVDVHTSEGADASAVFVELLGWMGARCVKTWNWNPNSGSPENAGNGTGSKVGITHVVFKDGGKRTLEKVRESNGVVQCVGVGWVLDCERQNTWLDEAPYAIDTSLVPRGGHKRRKSMEPRALANMNGTLTTLPASHTTPRAASHSFSPSKEFLNLPDTPGTSIKSDRRRSSAWFRSPASDEDQNHFLADDTMILSPVPPTPAPEMISAYAENILDGDVEMTPYFDKRGSMHDLVQRTAPPKKAARDESEVFEGDDAPTGWRDGEEKGVLMQRLLLARRKSLQWAPKVGSPLARTASYGH